MKIGQLHDDIYKFQVSLSVGNNIHGNANESEWESNGNINDDNVMLTCYVT